MSKRTFVYVDGFNLYYRALAQKPHKWLNLYSLAKQILDPENDIQAIKYYTARVSGNRDKNEPNRQAAYLRALKIRLLLDRATSMCTAPKKRVPM